MVVHGPHMWVVMGGPKVQFGTRRGELEIGSKFWPPEPPGAPLTPPRELDFHCFLCTFCEGKIGGSKGGGRSTFWPPWSAQRVL